MIKGCRKNMIHIKNVGSPYFEEAYFIVRADKESDTPEDDILREAQRIAGITDEAYRRGKLRKSHLKKSFFLYGASLCSLFFGIAMLILCY